jgi:hypothetical protein
MARNIQRYGYGPNRASDTPRTIVLAYHRHALARFEARKARRVQHEINARPGTPMSDGERIMAYYRQNKTPSRPLTPRQQRRRKHKDPSLRNL